jgi:hypothetical protein
MASLVLLERCLPLAEDENGVAVLRERLFVEHVDEGVAGIFLDDLAELAEETVEHLDLEGVDDAVLLLLGQLGHLAVGGLQHWDEPVIGRCLLVGW